MTLLKDEVEQLKDLQGKLLDKFVEIKDVAEKLAPEDPLCKRLNNAADELWDMWEELGRIV